MSEVISKSKVFFSISEEIELQVKEGHKIRTDVTSKYMRE
jgi:hypothetical protein